MERTVPVRSSEEIELYLRTIYSLLRSTNEVRIRSLEVAHAGMNSSLHTLSQSDSPDTSALVYALMRLPDCIFHAQKVIMGQSESGFLLHGIGPVETWEEVSARARRRRCFFDGKDRLACYIASRSDIDDVVPCLTALQIEWNKLHRLLNTVSPDVLQLAHPSNAASFKKLAKALLMRNEELARLYTVLGDRFTESLAIIAEKTCDFQVQLLSGSLNDYRKATEMWWQNIQEQFPQVSQRPIYFISSNTHSLTNILSGYALGLKAEILDFIAKEDPALQAEWEEIERSGKTQTAANFFYFTLKRYLSSTEGERRQREQKSFEQERGIIRVPSAHSFDIEAEIIDLSKLDPGTIDQRITPFLGKACDDWSFLRKTDALILNIDYPLGFAAYNLLTKIAENTSQILGIYVMGKAASLNGARGDVIIPNVVYDEHSRNTYLFDNHFTAGDVSSDLTSGTVMDNQKSVSVMGTFLQNSNIMDVIYREGYTDLEMEAGPYLSAVYEMFRPQRHPLNEIVSLYKLPFDLGVLHYVSDTPFSTGHNLGSGGLSYYGVDPTYAVSLAILRRIMALECQRIG